MIIFENNFRRYFWKENSKEQNKLITEEKFEKKIMKLHSLIFCLFILCGIFAVNSCVAQSNKSKDDKAVSDLTGNWSGESLCADREKFPGCHDEQVVYRIAKTDGKANVLTVTMDKLVNGEAQTMGVLEFVYDAEKQTLVNEFTRNKFHGIWEFAVSGGEIKGTLTSLPDKTIARRIIVRKDE